MPTKNKIRKNAYHDSATLMLITNKMAGELGPKNVAVMMGTDMNKDIMRESQLLTEEGEAATSNDLIFAAKGDDDAAVDSAVAKAEEALDKRSAAVAEAGMKAVRTLDSAVKEMPEANIAVVSIPGQYAKAEVKKALDQGLHVVLFSDNVPIEDEIELKDQALAKGLLMMGPDCGTAIINGTPLAFANSLAKGDIGVVAAAGTGLQETTVLISRNGGGITQGIGTGGRDVKEKVGGRMMLAALDALDQDPSTKVILLVAKPPARSVVEKLAERIGSIDKPVVTCFLGDRESTPVIEGTTVTRTLEAAAFEALRFSTGREPSVELCAEPDETVRTRAQKERSKFAPSQKYIRGLYAGGTLCYETMLIARDALEGVHSNTPVSEDEALKDVKTPEGHTFLDLGEDEFTTGRPHPMIEPSLRNQWILDQAEDDSAAVVLLDVVIGFGSHEDPAGVAAEAIKEAKKKAEDGGRYLSVVASVCGTEGDVQGFEKQKKALADVGVVVMPSNAQAARYAVLVAGGEISS